MRVGTLFHTRQCLISSQSPLGFSQFQTSSWASSRRLGLRPSSFLKKFTPQLLSANSQEKTINVRPRPYYSGNDSTSVMNDSSQYDSLTNALYIVNTPKGDDSLIFLKQIAFWGGACLIMLDRHSGRAGKSSCLIRFHQVPKHL